MKSICQNCMREIEVGYLCEGCDEEDNQRRAQQAEGQRSMVVANLHIICGNCGNGNKSEFVRSYSDGDEDCGRGTYLTCKNCATMHTLEDEVLEERATNGR